MDLVREGRTAARVGDLAEARRLLEQATETEPDNIEAWLELAGVVESPQAKRDCFARVLALDPDHAAARAGLERIEQKLDTGPTVCYRHPEVETSLRCNRCDRPICPKCAQRGPVGFRCPECVAEIEGRYYANRQEEYINPYYLPQEQPFITYLLVAAIVFIWVMMELAGGSTNSELLIRFGANYGPLIIQGQVWRLFTSIFLHIGLMHLAFNTIALLLFGPEMERLYGLHRFLVLYLLSGLFGSLLSFAVKGVMQFSAGASGAIFGIMGVSVAFYLLYRRRLGEYGRQRRNQMLALVAINLVLGFTLLPVDNMGHLGGLVSGFVLGYLLAPRYRAEAGGSPQDKGSLGRRWWVVLLAGLILVGGTWFALTFWRALLGW